MSTCGICVLEGHLNSEARGKFQTPAVLQPSIMNLYSHDNCICWNARPLYVSLILNSSHTSKPVSGQHHSRSSPNPTARRSPTQPSLIITLITRPKPPLPLFSSHERRYDGPPPCWVKSRKIHHHTSTLVLKAAPRILYLPENSSKITKTENSQ